MSRTKRKAGFKSLWVVEERWLTRWFALGFFPTYTQAMKKVKPRAGKHRIFTFRRAVKYIPGQRPKRRWGTDADGARFSTYIWVFESDRNFMRTSRNKARLKNEVPYFKEGSRLRCFVRTNIGSRVLLR